MKKIIALLALLPVLTAPVHAQGKLNVVTTTEDLAAIAREVAGDRAAVESIARGYQDPHFVEAKPSFILRCSAPTCWWWSAASSRSAGCRRSCSRAATRRFSRARPRYLDASLQARILDIPQGQITRAMGDVHPLGNPHYWLDPENGKVIARAVAGKLSELRPNDKAYFDQRLADFSRRIDEAEKGWLAALAPVQGAEGRHLPPLATRTSPTASGSRSSATSSRGRAFRRRRSTRSIWSTR